jgi:acyl-coenzyme A synthetase/AMP-(fatty) acid ligase
MVNQVPFFFDPSVKDIYLTMKCGATTHIIPKKLFMFPLPLLEFIAEKKATALNWSTAAFHMVANSKALEKFVPETVKKVVIGGETMYAKQLNIWRNALPDACYVNAYGPAEVTVDCTYYIIDREFEDHEAIPIGIECRNKEVMLLDENLNPVSVGEIGEIFVRGGGLALGYYGDTGKTDAAFVQNPHCPWYRDMLYRTGDIGVMNDDGLITFLTRRDGQIKHSGYRIELGEIEAQALSHPMVSEIAAVIDKDESGAPYIGLVYAAKERIGPDEFRRYLSTTLPDYMLPRFLEQVEQIPLTENGKVDRSGVIRRLAEVRSSAGKDASGAPRDELEEYLQKIWAEILGVANIGCGDDFFLLGGDSLKAIRILEQLKVDKVCAEELSLDVMFDMTSISLLAEKIRLLKEQKALINEKA